MALLLNADRLIAFGWHRSCAIRRLQAPVQPANQVPKLPSFRKTENFRRGELGAATVDRPSSSGRDADGDWKPRLAKVLAGCGIASRRACEALIAAGRVRVNGRLVSEQGTTIDPLQDRVEVLQPQPRPAAEDEEPAGRRAKAGQHQKGAEQQGRRAKQQKRQQELQGGAALEGAGPGAVTAVTDGVWRKVNVRTFLEPESLYYFAVNKPKGYICSAADVGGSGKLAVELLEPWLGQWRRKNKDPKRLPPRFFTVGRLDVASSGLLLITNDGEWANRVIHPSSGVTKEYVVGVAEDAKRQQLEALAAGTQVAGTFVEPLEVEVLGDPRRLRIVVQEGKKHEVRELVKAAGMELLSLRRVRIGGYRLPRDLGIGGYRELKAADLKLVTDPRAQQEASVSGATRQEQRRADDRRRLEAQRAAVPRALRGMSEEVLEKLRKANE